MAEDVVEHTLPAARAEPEALVEPRRPREQPRIHRWRFGIAYLALAVVAGLGVGVTILLYERPADPAEPAWSSWRPVGRETSYPDQIADYVGQRYRLPSGRQLAVVAASPPRVTTGDAVPVQAVVIQNQSALPSAAPEIEYVRTNNTIMYELCGLGQQCSISEGESNTERFQLLRREALELSLYTFKYMESIESVVTLLPPRGEETRAIYLRRQAFKNALERPLNRTLMSTPPHTSASIMDAGLVDQLTAHREFPAYFQRVSNGSVMLRLGGPPPQEPPQTTGSGQNP